jgi:hypothetical protein
MDSLYPIEKTKKRCDTIYKKLKEDETNKT